MKRLKLLLIVTSILLLYTPLNAYAETPTTPVLSDCSQFAKLPTNWGAQLVTAIKALKSTVNPTSAWAITYNVTSQPASNNFILTFWATANVSRSSATRSMWYAHDTTDPRKVTFNIDSSKGDVYRLIGVVHADGSVGIGEISGTLYDVAWAKTVNVPVQCAVLNHQTPVADLTGPLVWDLSYTSTQAQDVQLGFFDPPAASSGSSGGSTTITNPVQIDVTPAQRTLIYTILGTFFALALAVYLGIQFVKGFQMRKDLR